MPSDVVRLSGGLSRLKGLSSARSQSFLTHLDGSAAEHAHAETRRRAQTLLRGRDDDVETPVVEPDLLGSDRADSVEDDERVGRVLLDQIAEVRRGGEYAGGRVDWDTSRQQRRSAL